MQLAVNNVRLGLACNSSSSHSIILLSEQKTAQDSCGSGGDPDEQFSEFGWQFFTAASDEWKIRYLAICLRTALSREIPGDYWKAILKDWLPINPEDHSLNGDDIYDGYVDHQSVLSFPCEFGTDLPSKAFVKDVLDALLQERVVILGGNDNDENNHPLLDGKHQTILDNVPRETSSKDMVCRKDPSGFWTIFFKNSGNKIRFSFDENAQIQRSATPELIDVKITDFCPYGCNFCYQGSTTKGGHAVDTYRLVRQIAEAQVFEVALGGGEPTLYPDFANLLHDFRRSGVVPNFTTRNLSWISDPYESGKILDAMGSLAFSTEKLEPLKKLATLADLHNISSEKITVQVIMGLIDPWEFNHIARFCYEQDWRLTLLGYKTTGRGKSVKVKDDLWWKETIKSLHKDWKLPTIAVDTAFAKTYEKDILEMNVSEKLFHTQEGRFSMYIDAVRKKVGPSSYCEEDALIPWDYHDYNAPNIEDVFAQIKPV